MTRHHRYVLIAWLLVGAGCALAEETSTPAVDEEVMEKLRMLAGHPDIKPGVAATKAAAWAWMMQHVIEEYDCDHLRANLAIQQGQVLLPFGVNYAFGEGVLTKYEIEGRNEPPDTETARRLDADDQPWILVDRTLWGYSFKVPPTWRLIFERTLSVDGVNFRLTVIGMTKVRDPELDAWIENSLQWCVFEREKPFTKISEVMAAEERRLKDSGTRVVQRRKTADAHGFVYETTYGDNPYLGKTYFFVSEGKGVSLRFNATKGTYPINLPRFERFAKTFVLGRERAPNSDLELVRDGDLVLTMVGGVATSEELQGMEKELFRIGTAPSDE